MPDQKSVGLYKTRLQRYMKVLWGPFHIYGTCGIMQQ